MLSDVSTARRSAVISWRCLAACHDRDAAGAIGKRRRQHLRPELRHFIDAQRKHMGRQAGAEPRQGVDDFLAVLAVMKQHDGVASTRLAVGLQQRPQPPHQGIRARQCVGCCAGRTNRCARTAAGAYIGVDRDRIPVRRDRAGGAQIEASRASGNRRARVRAERFLEIDEARLVEGADEAAGVRDRALDGSLVARIGAQIARAQIMRGEQGIAARQIEDQIAGRGCAVARRSEHKLRARGRLRQCVVVNRKFEPPEMSAGIADRALEDREFVRSARGHVAGPGEKHGNVQAICKTLRRLDGDLVAAIDQCDAAALKRHQ